MLVSSASAMHWSLQPSPPFEASAFSRIRAFNTCRAGALLYWINAFSRFRSSILSRTT